MSFAWGNLAFFYGGGWGVAGALRAVPVWGPFPPGGPSCGGFLRLYGGRRGKVVDMFRRKNGVFLTVPFFFAAVKWLKLLTSFVRQRHLGGQQYRTWER